jgi:hypothetical protein
MNTQVKLSETKEGSLIRFSKKSDVYKVINSGFHFTLKNMLTEKVSIFKPYTIKGGRMYDRKVEIVDFY